MATDKACVKVLLVEDDPVEVRAIQELLANSSPIHFEAASVATLKDALESLRDHPPELILLDLQLPDSQGIDTLRAVRAVSNGAPIVVLTMAQDALLALSLVREGAQEHLIKTNLDQDIFIRTAQYAIERKKAEAALKQSEMQYRITTDSMSDALHVVDESLHIVLMNKQFKKWSKDLGFPEHPEGMLLFEAFPFLTDEVRKEYLEVFATGTMRITEEKTRLSDKEFCTETSKIPIFSEGKVVQVITVIRDITERKKTEEALKNQERFLNSVFMSIQDGVSVLGTDLSVIRVNAAMEKWYGHNMPLVGKKCYMAFHNHSEPCKVCPTLQALHSKKACYEMVPKRGAGGKIVGWIDLYSYPLFDIATGQMTGVIEYVRDISARKRAEEEKARLYTELAKTNQRLKKLSLRDAQTGLYNHRFLELVIESEFHRAKRYYHPLSVVLVDIDYFKSINDMYGHEFGDVVLKQLARELKKLVRGYDSVVRMGGEEFLIISPSTDRLAVMTFARRLLDALNLRNFGDQERSVKLKLSLAAVTYPDDKLRKGMELVDLAEQIIVKAKESGGNCVYSSEDIVPQKAAARSQENERAGVELLKSKLDKLAKKTNQGLIESIFALSKAIELKDHYTGEHVESTVRYATDLATHLGLPKHEVERVRQAAMLHDLGKIGISEKILLKKSKLTKKEFQEIKKHPQIGADILRPIQLLHDIIPLIMYHHERWDGKGYIHGLKREEIPLGARIIAVADVYQALTSDRPYRKAYPKEKALQIIRQGAGSQFDPLIVHEFLDIIQKKK